jgi:undecaprenyl-diphosphatase
MSVINAIILAYSGRTPISAYIQFGAPFHTSEPLRLNTAEEGQYVFRRTAPFRNARFHFFVYWRDIKDMWRRASRARFGNRHPDPGGKKAGARARLVIMIIVSHCAALIVLPLKDYVEALYYKTIFIGFALIITGFLLFISDKIANGSKNEKNMRIKDALIVGRLPGRWRSFRAFPGPLDDIRRIASGLSREFAVKFSFLMSITRYPGRERT